MPEPAPAAAEPDRRARAHPRRWAAVWLVTLGVGAVALSAELGVEGNAALAVAQDALPLLCGIGWIVLVVAGLGRRVLLAGLALAVAGYQLVLVVPALRESERPGWATDAPRVRIVVANVYVDNPDVQRTARTLLDADADVIAVLEANPRFLRAFDRAGGADRYRHRVADPGDTGDYAAALLSRLPLRDAGMTDIGPARVARARLGCGSAALEVVAVNPAAAVDPGGFDTWTHQVDALARYASRARGPFLLVGDLNTTAWRPGFQELLDAGLHDAHEDAGQGLSASFRLAADGPLADLGAVARLDHALRSDGVATIGVRDLAAGTSDHRPFVLDAAVRADGPCR